MPEAELKIRHVSYPVKSKGDAFWYGFSEALGRALAWGIVIGFAVLAISYFVEDEPAAGIASEQTE